MRQSLCFLFLLLGINVMCVAQEFEGQIQIQEDQKDSPTTVFTFKGDLAKMERQTTQGFVTIIKDRKTGQQTLLRNRKGKKIALIQNKKDMPGAQAATQQSQLESRNAVAKENGNEEKHRIVYIDTVRMIDQYSCNLVVLSTTNFEVKAWLTKDFNINFTDWFPSLYQKKREEKDLEAELAKLGFVMDLILKNLNTGEISHRKLTIVSQKVDPATFNIPADYRVSDLTNLNQTVQGFKDSAQRLKELQKGKND